MLGYFCGTAQQPQIQKVSRANIPSVCCVCYPVWYMHCMYKWSRVWKPLTCSVHKIGVRLFLPDNVNCVADIPKAGERRDLDTEVGTEKPGLLWKSNCFLLLSGVGLLMSIPVALSLGRWRGIEASPFSFLIPACSWYPSAQSSHFFAPLLWYSILETTCCEHKGHICRTA